MAVGNYAVELSVLAKHGIFDKSGPGSLLADIFLAVCVSVQPFVSTSAWSLTRGQQPDLNPFAALPTKDRSLVRTIIMDNLSNSKSPLFENQELNSQAFIPLDEVQMHMPLSITDYTDFFSSFVHADNVRSLNRFKPLGV